MPDLRPDLPSTSAPPPEAATPGARLPALADAASITALLARRVLDDHLAALVWLLAEAGVPVVVAAPSALAAERRRVAAAVEPLAAPVLRRVTIDASGRGLEGLTAADATSTLLVGADLTDEPAPALQVPFKAVARGADIIASIQAGSLEEVRARLRRVDLRLSEDELTFIGLVLVLAEVRLGAESVRRLTVAHYVRPFARDTGGHVQRPGPAVLATWDAATDQFEDFAWGITADLAARAGLRAGDLDTELQRRGDYLAGLVDGGVWDAGPVRSAVAGYRLADKGPGAH